MNQFLTDEQRLVQQTARKIAETVLAPRAKELDEKLEFPREGLKALAEKGFMGMAIPPPLGGAGMDSVSFVAAVEEIAKACASTALVLVTHTAASFGILMAGTEEQKRRYLPALGAGKTLGLLAATEPTSGADTLAVGMMARREGDGFKVNGSKIFITNADEADVNLILLRTEACKTPADFSLLIVEKGSQGLSFGQVDRRMGMNGVSSREIVFQDCKVPASNLLGEEGKALMTAMGMAGLGVLGAAAISVGLAQASLDASIRYSKERTVRGQSLASHQSIQQMVADMSTSIGAARSFLYTAAMERDRGLRGPPLNAFGAKLFASRMALEVTDVALQIHGGHGYTKELPVERYYRDARGLTLHFSPTELLKEAIGQMILGLMP